MEKLTTLLMAIPAGGILTAFAFVGYKIANGWTAETTDRFLFMISSVCGLSVVSVVAGAFLILYIAINRRIQEQERSRQRDAWNARPMNDWPPTPPSGYLPPAPPTQPQQPPTIQHGDYFPSPSSPQPPAPLTGTIVLDDDDDGLFSFQ